MENFFCDDKFISDLDDLLSELDIDEENISDLEDDWEITCEEAALEPIFTLTEDFIASAVLQHTDKWEHRFPEDSEYLDKQIRKAIVDGIDIEKVNSLLPKLYYPNGKTFKITKKHLVEHLK